MLFGNSLKVTGRAVQSIYEVSSSHKDNFLEGIISGDGDIVYTISGWAKGTGQSYSSDSKFGLQVIVDYYTNTGSIETQTEEISFDKGITGWQFLSGGFVVSPGTNRIVNSIKLSILYNGHSGEGCFDNISLVRDSSTTHIYNYRSNGYLESYNSGLHKSKIEYYENEVDIKKITSSNRTIVEYTYDSSGNVLTEKYSRFSGIYQDLGNIQSANITWKYTTTYTYNTYGQVTSTTTVSAANSTQKIVSSATYNTSTGSHIFGTLDTETDSLGNTTRYYY